MTMHLLRHPGSPQGDGSGEVRSLGPSSAELLERYLDGQLDDRERSVFENSLESDPILREHLELQKRIDAGLRTSFTPLDLPALVADVVSPSGLPETATTDATAPLKAVRPSRGQGTSWVRIAAAVTLFMGGYLLYQNLAHSGPKMATTRPARIAPTAAYARELEKGMQPYVACTTSEAFAAYTKERLGIALAVQPTDGLSLIGWNYDEPVFGERTITMLATYHDKSIVIFMDQSDQPGGGCAKDSSDTLDQSTRTIGRILLQEVRPKGTPSILERIESVEK